jgi:hypothetical protein
MEILDIHQVVECRAAHAETRRKNVDDQGPDGDFVQNLIRIEEVWSNILLNLVKI